MVTKLLQTLCNTICRCVLTKSGACLQNYFLVAIHFHLEEGGPRTDGFRMSRSPHRQPRARSALRRVLLILFLLAVTPPLRAQEKPYFVAYDDQMEEPGNLEFGISPVVGLPKTGNTFVGTWLEFEYGIKAWWTSEFYLDGQHTRDDSTIFTGFRWENRFRPLR